VDEEAYDEVIVISEAVEGQHYSYTGGPVEGNPDTVPPGDDWQANTHQEPHLNNPNITWVDEFGVGLHYTSQGSSGNADYFYFQPPVDEVTEVVHHDAVTHKEYLFERSICTEEPPKPCQEDDPCWDCETDGNQNCGPDDKPEPKPEPEPTNPQPDKPTLPHTGAGSTALLGLIGTLLISSGAMLYRRFS
jgi:LPXTG-motif cell wall-anchored protein